MVYLIFNQKRFNVSDLICLVQYLRFALMFPGNMATAFAEGISKEERHDIDDQTKRAMFGDAFGSRGDYSKGFFYGGRRKFIKSEAEGNVVRNILEPPELFMTRDQMRHHKGSDNNGIKFKLDFNPTSTMDGETKASKAAQIRKQEGQSKKNKSKSTAILVERFSSTRKEDWHVCSQAGCTFYVNSDTGEATSEIPWLADGRRDTKGMERTNSAGLRSSASYTLPGHQEESEVSEVQMDGAEGMEEDEEGEGTGAPVYDSSELESFLQLLDTIKK